jgi:hypothetical protein
LDWMIASKQLIQTLYLQTHKNIISKYTTKLITFWTRRLQDDHPYAGDCISPTPVVLEKTGSNNRPFLCRFLYWKKYLHMY